MNEKGIPTFFEVTAVPAQQPILDEFDDIVVGKRRGVLVSLESGNNPAEPLWTKFVPERSLDFDFKIPLYERRIRRAKRKAAKFAAAIAFENY